MTLLLIVLALAASVSPLLTLMHLWQIKEWRWDRLMEHLREEGVFSSLFSRSRLAIGGLWILGGLLLLFIDLPGFNDELLAIWPLILVGTLALFGITQLALKRQPLPVWTRKAQSIVFLGMVLTGGIGLTYLALLQPSSWAILLLPYLQFVIVALAWLILYPLDRFLKQHILSAAMAIRAARPNVRVIGITGSVGKTTTKELLRHVLKDLGAIATPHHVNTEMGVAKWLTETLTKEPADSSRILIVEMGAYRAGEIALLCDIAKPSIGVLTYVGRQHVALFGGEQGIAKAKGELLASLPKDGRAFVNADSPLIDVLLGFSRCPVLTAGTDHRAMLKAFDIEETSKGIRFQAEETVYDVPLAGTHMVTNILLCIAVATSFGMNNGDIAKKLSSFTAFERTFARRQENGVTVLDNTYNASPEGFIAAIDWAAHQQEKEKVLLFDGIIELGDDEERIHREIAERAAKVFQKAYVLHPRYLPYFKEVFGPRVTEALRTTETVQPGTLLVCMGRMPQSLIRKFLP